MAAIGTDNQLWTTAQPIGAATWQHWTPRGVFAGKEDGDDKNNNYVFDIPIPPSCAAIANGDVAMAYVDSNNHPNFALFNNGSLVSGWSQDSTGWQTNAAIHLSSQGNTVWSVFSGVGETIPHNTIDETYFRQIYNF